MNDHLGRRLAFALLPLIAACSTDGVTHGVKSAGSAVGNAASSMPSLVNVDLNNVLNNLAVQLHIDRANIPVNAQVPITIAANVCGVSINVLSVSNGGRANCTAQTSSPELAQVVQQQMAAAGNVGGGAQGGSTAGTGGTSPTPQPTPAATATPTH